MGCRLGSLNMKPPQGLAPAETNWENGVTFVASDVVEIQTILWNILVLEGTDKAREVADLRRLVEEIRASVEKLGWEEPTAETLAGRLIHDTIEREEQAWDMHVVRNLSTEDQVLETIFTDVDGTHRIKLVALEILLQWYVNTADCKSMLMHVEHSRRGGPFRPEDQSNASSYLQSASASASEDEDGSGGEGGDAPKDSLQSFVWRGSPDVAQSAALRESRLSIPPIDTPTHPSSPPLSPSPASACDDVRASHTARALSAALGSPSRMSECHLDPSDPKLALSFRSVAPVYHAQPFTAYCARSHNDVYLLQLCLCLRGALRTALRQYSTSHYDGRGKQLKSVSQRVAGSEWSRDRERAIARCGSLSSLPAAGLLLPPERMYPLTVVLDLDETLVFARQGPLWVRPGVSKFLHDLRDIGCEVVCWTASNRTYAGGILSRLDPMAEVVSQCIYSHPKWQRRNFGGPQVKNLGLVGRDLNHTIIVDNLPDSVVGNEMNAIVVENYEGCELHDGTLPTLSKVIKDLVGSGLTVPEFLRDRCRSGQHLKYCEMRLANQETTWCFVLNSEPAQFSLAI